MKNNVATLLIYVETPFDRRPDAIGQSGTPAPIEGNTGIEL